jgi:acetoacetate decarboxylase
MAGRGYKLLGVNADVIFNGKEDQLPGSYTLTLWENLLLPTRWARTLR